jgi:arabinan endo-1,5-alpha-L-arabinosidase
MIYHAVDLRRARTKPKDDLNTRRILLIDPIEWRDGWPRIENNGPSAERKRAPRVR